LLVAVRRKSAVPNGIDADESLEGRPTPHPVVHAEIRSQDPDATRAFFAELFDWKVASEGAFPGYTFIDTGVEGGPYVAISPRQADQDEVLFFVAVEDVAATLEKAEALGGSIIQPAQSVPGTSFGVLADVHGHRIGVAATT
jgi:predicted enzyme related to lactoylglutathione lyase